MTDEETSRVEIGKELKQAREYRGFSQKEIGEILGASKEYVSLVEAGKEDISNDDLEKLARLYNTTVDQLIGGLDSGGETEQVELLARAAQNLSDEDKEEVLQFANYLTSLESRRQENG